ncbi:hypothetical protein Patl1_00097 [Pistacia atlantica]|uniref:Uncharacterized protein n=1 Tax=Pistacia atlantica TaxID=434234 RepID=A0ACC1C5I9_9ROSI|nr:hypothetical protein Patl1_00097 [Pistacia atlantica]
MNDRVVSYTFGADKVSEFLKKHDLELVCRAHQVVEDGYEFFADRQLVTIFSAPNYCGLLQCPLVGVLGNAGYLTCNLEALKARDGSILQWDGSKLKNSVAASRASFMIENGIPWFIT